jgi:hypothetical protein
MHIHIHIHIGEASSNVSLLSEHNMTKIRLAVSHLDYSVSLNNLEEVRSIIIINYYYFYYYYFYYFYFIFMLSFFYFYFD